MVKQKVKRVWENKGGMDQDRGGTRRKGSGIVVLREDMDRKQRNTVVHGGIGWPCQFSGKNF